MEEEYPDPIPMTEKDKRDFKFNNRERKYSGRLMEFSVHGIKK
jgi:hypothetical protein